MTESVTLKTPRIQSLSIQLANQIAAGEVVERPASVVKELMENALDAGATEIILDVEKAGTRLIRITDNGCGIHKDDLPLALSRHATSKIASLDDLEAVLTLGFRGEALASISSVSRLSLISKPATQDHAWQAYAEGRDMAVEIKPAAHPIGTTIEVRDLFYNTPARRKFLRTEKTEFAHIEDTFKRIALSHMTVAFRLQHNQKVIYQLRAAENEAQRVKRLAQLCGRDFAEHAQALDCQIEDMRLQGWLSAPAPPKSHLPLQSFFINGRMTRDKVVNHSIRVGYQSLLQDGLSPCYVLFLTLDARQLDVNVHPTKHEVRFKRSRWVHDFISSHVQRCLSNGLIGHTQSALEQAPPVHVSESNDESRAAHVVSPMTSASNGVAASNHWSRHKPDTKRIQESQSFYQQLFTAPAVQLAEPSDPNSAENTENTSPIQQLIHQRYFVLADPEGMRIYDAVQIELQLTTLNYWLQLQQHQVLAKPLLVPQRVALDHSALDMFDNTGWRLQSISTQSVQIEEVPQLLFQFDYPALLQHWQQALPKSMASLYTCLRQASPKASPDYTLSSVNALFVRWQQQAPLLQSLGDTTQLIQLDV